MGCCCNRDSGKLLATLSFDRNELFYDIGNAAFVEGDLLGDDQAKLRQMIQDITEDGNADIVTRSLNTTYFEIVEALYPFTKRRIPTSERPRPWIDPNFRPNVYIIDLTLPETFSVTSVNLMEADLHNCLVYRALSDWLGIVSPQAAVKWAERAAAAREKVMSAMNSDMKGHRIRIHTI